MSTDNLKILIAHNNERFLTLDLCHTMHGKDITVRGFRDCRVAPTNYSAGALARTVRGQFDHTAPPPTRLMEMPKGLRIPLAGEVDNPSTNPETVPNSTSLVGSGG